MSSRSGLGTWRLEACTALVMALAACGGGPDSGGAPSGDSASQSVTVTAAPPAPTVSIAIAPSTVMTGQRARLSWSSTNATACRASGAWTNTQQVRGSLTVSPSTPGSYPYTLECSNASGSTTQTATLIVSLTP